MIALQVAAGIVLAALVLRFWRQALWLALGLVVVAAVALAVLVAYEKGDSWMIGVLIGAVLSRWVVGKAQARAGKASPPAGHR